MTMASAGDAVDMNQETAQVFYSLEHILSPKYERVNFLHINFVLQYPA